MTESAAPSPIPADARPRLPRGVRLTHNEAQGGWVLLAPERVFKADADRSRDRQALHRRGDLRRNRRRSRQDLQRAARAHPCRRDRAVARPGRQEAAWSCDVAGEWRRMRCTSPLGLLAELTHRCPLGCPYCSNPLRTRPRARTNSTPRPGRGFSGGGGARRAAGASLGRRARRAARSRRDHGAAHAAGLYTNLITSAVGITDKTLGAAVGCRPRSRADLDPGQHARNPPTVSPAMTAPSQESARSPPRSCGSNCRSPSMP